MKLKNTKEREDGQGSPGPDHGEDECRIPGRLDPFRREVEDPPFRPLTPLLHKDAVESTAYPHQKVVYTLSMISSKSHFWIDPSNNIDLTVIPLWVRVG
jgi:hypothetical protein